MATKKKCTRCGVVTLDWMEVNMGPPICYSCNKELIEMEKFALNYRYNRGANEKEFKHYRFKKQHKERRPL